MSDYLLNKIYETLLKKEVQTQNSYKTLAESYKKIYEQETEQQFSTPSIVKPKTTRRGKPSAIVKTTSEFIDNILAQGIEKGTISQTEPVGDYSLDNLKILPEDMPVYKLLFAESPPTQAGIPQSKGSGKGELALFWLLRKKNNVEDTRGKSNPDLTVNGFGVEVKSVPSKWVNLGRFGSQDENLKLLSILFGLEMVLNISNKVERPPSLEDFDKTQLIRAFEAVSRLDKIAELRAMATTYEPIQSLYSQVDFLLKELDLISNKFDINDGAAKLLKKILIDKLRLKPGVDVNKPGYIVNCFIDGNIKLYTITQEKIDKLTPVNILNNVKASSPNLQMQLHNLFGNS